MRTDREQVGVRGAPRTMADHLDSQMLTSILDGGKPMPSGRRIANYRLLAEVARRGDSVVVRAIDETLGGEVALKLLDPRHASEDVERQLFSEAAVLARLSGCEGLVRFRAAGRFKGIAYLATRWVEALPLAAWLQRKQPSMNQRIAVLVGLARSLEAMHDLGVAHLDISPSNVLVCHRTQRPIICDLGAADLLDGAGSVRQVVSDTHVGSSRSVSPGYSAPEMVVAGAFGCAGVWSDIYSLGGLAFLLATGDMPVKGRNAADLVRNTLTRRAPDARAVDPAIPQRLASLIRRCLQRRAERRPRSMAAVAAMLASMLDIVPAVGVGPETHLQTPWRGADRVTAEYQCQPSGGTVSGSTPSRVVAAAAMLLLAGVGNLAGLWIGSTADDSSQTATATLTQAGPVPNRLDAGLPGVRIPGVDKTGSASHLAETR